jgi:hypothetical protein
LFPHVPRASRERRSWCTRPNKARPIAKHANCERGGGMRQTKLMWTIFLLLWIAGGLRGVEERGKARAEKQKRSRTTKLVQTILCRGSGHRPHERRCAGKRLFMAALGNQTVKRLASPQGDCNNYRPRGGGISLCCADEPAFRGRRCAGSERLRRHFPQVNP